MFNQLLSKNVQCPYCWETIEILVDGSVESQDYVEDCQVCCRPIQIRVVVDSSDNVIVSARDENEV